MSHHKIEMRGVSFSYPDGHRAVSDLSFAIAHGESVGILGANGAGKSTLLSLLMGVLTPTAGHVLIGDVKYSAKTLPEIRRRLGFVFQNPDDQLFMNTLCEDIAFGPRNAGLDEAEVALRVQRAMETVGILHLKDRPPYKLSGGEKRAAAIAGVLAMEPDALILDEPTSDLDPRARRRTMALLSGFHHTRIIATHDIDMVYDLCDRTIILQDGRIMADAKTTDILCDAKRMEAYGLETPLSMQGCPVCGRAKADQGRESST